MELKQGVRHLTRSAEAYPLETTAALCNRSRPMIKLMIFCYKWRTLGHIISGHVTPRNMSPSPLPSGPYLWPEVQGRSALYFMQAANASSTISASSRTQPTSHAAMQKGIAC